MSQLDWTPEEIRVQNFGSGIFGYSRKEVREFLLHFSKLWGQLLLKNSDLTRRVNELENELAQWRNREQELKDQTARAQSEAERLMQETEKRADEIREKTETWLEDVIARVEETQRQKQSFLSAFKASLDSHYELLQGEESDAEPLTARLTDVLRGQPLHRSN